MAKSSNRPVSPHLTSGGMFNIHYVWGPHMLVSILHRATGAALAIVGMPLLLWWLYSIAAGAETYATFIECATSPVGFVVLIGLSYCLFEHIFSGLRHFVLDIGAGYELVTNKNWAVAVMLLALLATAALWAVIFLTILG